MKTLAKVVALMLALSATAAGQSTYIRYVPNPALPLDMVEIAPDYALPLDFFYANKPAQRPADAPPTFVLVQVMRVDREKKILRLLGWIYLDADTVNALHLVAPTEPVAMRTL